eukprot:GILI01033705.1.p1 GENE.GILI01033705.1~~GILI01033705.1.p1  ORF type:complete len:228 (+),score=25.06 GILI01033705.1:48-686(+)
MSILSETYPKATKLKLDIQHELELIETGRDNSVAVQQSVSAKVNELARIVESLETEVDKEPAGKRELWKRRVRQLSDDATMLRAGLEKYLTKMYRQRREAEEQKSLFERRNGTAGGSSIDAYTRENNALKRSHTLTDEYIAHGRNILNSLSDQKDKIKGAQRKVLDVANSLGLSSSLLRIIDRRHQMDRWLVYGGMIVTLIVLWGSYKLVHG